MRQSTDPASQLTREPTPAMDIETDLDEVIATAASLLRAGKLVAFPTETVYGIGANAVDDKAVSRVFALKGRPSSNPLICHVSDISIARDFAVFGDIGERLCKAFWPGPLTLVLPMVRHANISRRTTAGLSTVAVRCPSHPVAHEILRRAALPIAAPSANRSGKVSATTADHVRADFATGLDLVVDVGRSPIGLESTVIDLSEGDDAVVLRHGAIGCEDLASIVAVSAKAPDSPVLKAPGLLASHYAPNARLRLNAENCRADEAFLGFGLTTAPSRTIACNLSKTGNLAEAASNLYRMMREIDQTGVSCIAVAAIPDIGIGVAINDRLRRAAAPRG